MPGRSTLPCLVLLLALILASAVAAETKHEVAIFAGGCFWCVEADFDKVAGVTETVSGFIGGRVANPSYKRVVAGGTGHREAVRITYDPDKVTYGRLLDIFWHSVDPTDDGGQFCDRGESYTTAIFATSAEQKQLAEQSKAELDTSGALKKPVVTAIDRAEAFYPAEDYHQNYYEKNSLKYNFYRFRCGRDGRLEELWGDKALLGIRKN